MKRIEGMNGRHELGTLASGNIPDKRMLNDF